MKYFIIAGEQSGDLHGSNLISGLRRFDDQAVIECWGGDLMEAAGARLRVHYSKTAFMGFVSVLKNLRTINNNFALCKEQISDFKPDVVIFIDYPGFNLRMARYCRECGYTTFWYISPKLWAWNEKRVDKIRKYVDRMFIIFPFEVGFYKKHGISVEYHGNPVVDEIGKRMSELPSQDELRKILEIDERPVIGLLAGSRRHEIEHVLPKMVSVIERFPGYQFVLAGVKNIPDDFYMSVLKDARVKLIKEKTYEVLSVSEAALVTSGTATLETALIGVPQVVCFKGDLLSMLIAWMVIKVKYISLVNLIMEREVVRELIQFDLRTSKIADELAAIVRGGKNREELLASYHELKEKLGPSGASGRIASEMVEDLKNRIPRSV